MQLALSELSDSATDPTSTTSLKANIMSRDEHRISRRDISQPALNVLYGLHDAGYEGYLVGGAVRDLLLGGKPKDFDIATNATPEQVKSIFRNSRLIGRRFRLAHVIFGRELVEVATFRANDDDGSGGRQTEEGGRLIRDNVYGSIEDDAVRRDFTVNALYYTVDGFVVKDFVGGLDDIKARQLRLIGDPEQRYREDPVRMLRAVRLAAKLGFSIEQSAAEKIQPLAGLLETSAPARLFDECLKLFLTGHAESVFGLLEHYGLLSSLVPDSVKAMNSNRSGALRTIVVDALRNTDLRVAEDKPVTPAFLFAALLWPAYCLELAKLERSGVELAAAQHKAADHLIIRQVQRIALPRRFSLPMQEIWLLQARFAQRQKKRVLRFLQHPRFRAAFDFFQLRAQSTEELREDLAFWIEAQDAAPEELADRLDAKSDSVKPKRRRRVRKKSGPAAE